jgi:hypothetical protein
MSKDALDLYLESLERKKAELDTLMDTFSEQAVKESDGFKRVIDKMMVRYAEIIIDIFNNIGMLAKAQVGINNKIEALTEILLELPEVKGNLAIQTRIEEIFKEYDDATEGLK